MDTKGIIGMLVCAMALLLSGIGRAQPSANGQAASTSAATNIIPLIKMHQVPIGTAIGNLARDAGVNYLIDQRLFQNWVDTREPAVTCKLQNIAARDALQQVLTVHKLALVENPFTGVARITSEDQPVNAENTNLLNSMVAAVLASDTNAIIPVIECSDVPLDVVLEYLVKQCGIKCDYSSRLQDDDVSPWFASMPSISLRWKKITAIQALFALCENYNLTITRNDATGTLHIEPLRFKRHHHILLH